MARSTERDRWHGPVADAEPEISIAAVPFDAGRQRSQPLLSAPQRRRLLALATRMRLPAGTTIYREADELAYIFIVGDGLVKSFRELASGKRRIVAFLFPRDVFGLASRGRYVNTTQTVTASAIYRIPHESLTAALQRDADLQFRFLCKVTQKLRESQRHAIVLGRRDAIGRVAMFLKMLERDAGDTPQSGVIPVPMRRVEIAEYLGLSHEAVSRAIRALALRKIVAVSRHAARVKDRAGFEALVAAT
jgi:CRP-like cAMP-binding protein